MELQNGTLLHGDTYRIEKTLGQGSFGITYLAEHVYLGKKVAIKEFFMKEVNSRGADGSITNMSDSSLSYNYCQKFKKEAINLSHLDHPNIVGVTDLFAENGTFYYVMDYIEGENLNDYIKTHRLSEGEAVNIIKCVAEALIYMHEKHHMLHLDLKPSNIMRRDNDGHIFLIDFGLSKHFDKNGEPESSTTIGLGTAGYAPIEQGDSTKSGEFRTTIDVYALSATFYKLLTGETPSNASLLVSKSTLIEDNLRQKGISESLIKAVVDAMRPSVDERTQTIRAFVEMLNKKQGEEDTIVVDVYAEGDAQTDEAPEKTRSSKRNPAPWYYSKRKLKKYAKYGAGACILLAVILGIRTITGNRTESVAEADTTAVASPSSYQMTINGNRCTYTGEIATDADGIPIAVGDGEARFENGNYYKGGFADGKMHGANGYYVYSNGDTFEGSFVSDHFSEGTYTVKESGEYFTGTFDAQGQPKKGTWYNKNGDVLEEI